MAGSAGQHGTDETRRRKLLGLLGLARRAGQLALGATAVEKSVKRGERPLIVLATDAGASLAQSVGRLAPVRGLVTGLVTSDDLAQALGRDKLAVVGTTSPDFIRGIEKLEA
jgi:ribosomal protein L7Ae-like RNA K-turn-binding protein